MPLDLTYDGDPSALTLAPGAPLFAKSVANQHFVRRVDFSGELTTLVFDPLDGGSAFTVHFSDPRIGSGGAASVRTENRLALEAERARAEKERAQRAGLAERPSSASISPRQYTRWR